MIPAPVNVKIITKKDGDTLDIIAGLKGALPIATKQLKNFAKEIKEPGDTAKTFAYKVAAFIQSNFRYVKDGFDEQLVKLPSALYKDKTGDCKSFSLFFAGAMAAAGFKNQLKFVSYQKNGNFTHVFNVYEDNGILQPIDTCIKPFNRETNHKKSALMNVAILGEPEINGKRREQRKKRREERKQKRQERREERKASGGGRPVRRVALAPGRGAFLLIITLNVRNLAKRLSEAPKEKLTALWKRLGGKPDKLFAAIDKGKGKPRILGFDEFSAEIGEPTTAAAAITTAAPILLAVMKFLKGIGKQEEGDTELGKELKDSGAEPLGAGTAIEDPEPGSVESSRGAADPNYKGEVGRNRQEIEANAPESGGGLFANKNMLLYIAGGAALIFFLTRKK